MPRIGKSKRTHRNNSAFIEGLERRVLLSASLYEIAFPATLGGSHTAAMHATMSAQPSGGFRSLQAASNVAATKTSLTVSPLKAAVGTSVTLTATVTSSGNPVTPRTGTITFMNGGTVVGVVALDGNSSAHLTLTPHAGANAFSATYSGDANFLRSNSASRKANITIDKVVATLNIPTGISVGNPVTLTATIRGQSPGSGTPTGSVTFKDGGTVLGTAQLAPDGTATIVVTPQKAGNHTYSISYSGDANHAKFKLSHPAIKLTGGGGVVLGHDLTYIGQFKTDWSAQPDPVSNIVTGTGLSFNITIKLHPLIPPTGGLAVYTITSVTCSEPYFGALGGVVPTGLSLATLPSPPLNSSVAGSGFTINFPNGTSLSTKNAAGDMHQSSDGRIISNSLTNTDSWFAGPDPHGDPLALEREMIPIKFTGPSGAGFMNMTWALTLSAT